MVGTGVAFYGNRSASYGELYRTHPSVRLVGSFLARNIGQLGLKVYRPGCRRRARLPRS